MSNRAKSVTVHLTTKDQKIESLHGVLARIGGLVDCVSCGRMAVLRVDLLGDPPPELGKLGVTSFQVHE